MSLWIKVFAKITIITVIITFQSLFCGWRGSRGRSLLPGRMCSGGVQSICSSSLPFFFRLPLSTEETIRSQVRLTHLDQICFIACCRGHIQWGKKVFSQSSIVQVLPLKKMRPVIFTIGTLQLWQTKWEKKSRKTHCRIFYEFICKLWWKISIWSPTNKQDFWLSQRARKRKRLLCPPLVTCFNGTCLNLSSV